MTAESIEPLDPFGGWTLLVLAGLAVGGATALVYDGPYEFLPVAAGLLAVALGARLRK